MSNKFVDSDFVIDARPKTEGKDPLAEGNTLINPTNSEDENVYELLESSEDVRKAEKILPKRDPKPSHPYNVQVEVPKIRNVKNKSEEELEKVVKSSHRTGR